MAKILPYRLPLVKGGYLLDPHVVIIGAGASIASCPIDKNGRESPSLKGVHNTIGLTERIKSFGFSESELEDFESFYSNIYGKPEYAELQKELEQAVSDYFSALVIPDEITLYDYLILSLTEKDAIISFNWDPFLMQSYKRNLIVGNLPRLIFPHGNTGVGICYSCRIKGYANCLCNFCNNPFENMPLLFPVGKKKYNDNSIIENEWKEAKDVLERAAGITIWGYSAPKSDTEAYSIIKSSYQKSDITRIAPFTIINQADKRESETKKWQDIFDERMIIYTNTLKDTLLWNHPRVSLETVFDAILQCHPREDIKAYKDFSTLAELQEFVKAINEYSMRV